MIIIVPVIYSQQIPGNESNPSVSGDTKLAKKYLPEFTRLTDGWVKAYDSKNADNLIPFYSEDARYVSSHVSGLEAFGRKELIANFQHGVDIGGFINKVEIISISISGNMATLYCKYVATNSGTTVSGRNLLVLERKDKNWLIILHMTVI